MRFLRLLSRVVLLSTAAAAFAGLIEMYADSIPPRAPEPRWQAEHRSRPPQPQAGRFPSFLAEGILVAFIALGGRIGLRLRLSPESPSEGKAILLDLGRHYSK